MIKFLHTADWQLGMTRHFLSEGVQERFTQARFDVIREIGQIAKDENCQFIVVSGDVFDSNLLESTTIARALEAMRDASLPIYLLPGNHDPLNMVSIYHNKTFLDRKPSNVHVIDNNTPIFLDNNVEIIGAPWSSKRPLYDLTIDAIKNLKPSNEVFRILIGHGIVDKLSPSSDDPAVISLEKLESAISNNLIHYVALGDRHSLTQVGGNENIWYSGAPEPTAYDEIKSGMAIIVTIDDNLVSINEKIVGKWKFIERKGISLNEEADIIALREWLDRIENKERTIIKLRFVGTISLSLQADLEELLDRFREISAALEVRNTDLVVIPDDSDFTDLGFSGFVNSAVDKLRVQAESNSANSLAARDALAMLVRFAEAQK